MYSLRRPPCTTSPLPQGSSHFGSPGRLPAHARPSGAIWCHPVPFISAAITEQSWTSRGYQQKADSWKRRSQQDGSLPVLFIIRADWVQPPQPPHDKRGSEAAQTSASQTHGYGVYSPESANGSSSRRDRIRAGRLRHGRRHGRAGELATRSAPGTTPGRHTS